jgi:1,2-diacylglycerol 3-beta-glucosyltransferase
VSLLIALSSSLGLFIVTMFIVQVTISTYGLRRRIPTLTEGNPQEFEWHAIVPALNEASVIETTAQGLLTFPGLHVWIIDDGSDDGTLAIAQRLANESGRVHVIARFGAESRQGKGRALNVAYQRILEWKVLQQQSGAPTERDDRTIIGIVDADGVLDPRTFEILAGSYCFANPAIGGVQQDVRMREIQQADRSQNSQRPRLLIRLQDLEFQASIAAIQHQRHRTGSVSMGGNGQWTRLTALKEITALDTQRWQSKRAHQKATYTFEGPWHGSLLEDFEVGLHLLMTGWVTRFTPGCWVSQEAVPTVGAYIRQRTRWCQGSMQCARYLPDLWCCSYIGPLALTEIVYYLIQPWLWIFGTLLFPLPLISVVTSFAKNPLQWFTWVASGGWVWCAMFVFIAVAPLTSWGFTYRIVRVRTDGIRTPRRHALMDGLGYVALVHLSYAIAWKALTRLVFARNGWVKTTHRPLAPAVPK